MRVTFVLIPPSQRHRRLNSQGLITPALLYWVALLTLALVATNVPGQGSCDPAPSGLVGWWPGEGNAKDIAGGNNGTLVGGVTFTNGEVGAAFSLNGSDGYISVPNSPSLNFGGTSPMSVELWLYRTGTATSMHMIGKRDGCLEFEYQLAMDGSGTGFGSLNNRQMGYNSVGIPGWQPPLNTWTHLAATFDGSTFSFYTNGVLAATGSGMLGSLSSGPLEIGESGSCGLPFAGLIDEVSMYNRALSSNEIAAIFAAGSAGKCTPVPDVKIIAPANNASQWACTPFTITASATSSIPSIIDLVLLLDGTNRLQEITYSSNSPATEITAQVTFKTDILGSHSLTARAANDFGGVSASSNIVNVVAPPLHVLVADAFITNSQCLLCMSGQVGHAYSILASTNFEAWTNIGTMQNVGGLLEFPDPRTTNFPYRFYRAQQQ